MTWLTTRDAAEHLGLSPRTLEGWRYLDIGPAWEKKGRTIRYRMSDLDGWMSGEKVPETY